MENNRELALATENELAVSTAVAAVTAEIKSCLQIAKMFPRDIDNARVKILDTCRRPGFAPSVCYNKPIGGKKISGISIRGAEVAANNWCNIKTMVSVVYDDDKKRILNIMSMDLETNTSYSKQITVEKVIERKFVKKGQVKLYERKNSSGENVYGIIPTSDEFDVKVSAQTSKQIRNNILRLIPEDIKDEMVQVARETMRNTAAQDPQGEIKKIVDAFATLRIMPNDLKKFLGHDVGRCSPHQIEELRVMYQTINDGEAIWTDYLPGKVTGKNDDNGKSRADKLKDDLSGDSGSGITPSPSQEENKEPPKETAAEKKKQIAAENKALKEAAKKEKTGESPGIIRDRVVRLINSEETDIKQLNNLFTAAFPPNFNINGLFDREWLVNPEVISDGDIKLMDKVIEGNGLYKS